jgi:hypothetical protein
LAYFDKKEPIELVKYFKDIIKRPELLKNIEWDSYSAGNANQYLNKIISFQKSCDKVAVITDSLTNLTGTAVNWSLAHRGQYETGKQIKDASTVKPEMSEYQTETSYVVQAIDICKSLKCHTIWTAHPLPKLEMGETVGADGRPKMSITKTNSLVTYGSKVAGMVPGNFTEIYHFSQASEWNKAEGRSRLKYVVNTEAQGDEFAKTALRIGKELDITSALFYDVWKQSLDFNSTLK